MAPATDTPHAEGYGAYGIEPGRKESAAVWALWRRNSNRNQVCMTHPASAFGGSKGTSLWLGAGAVSGSNRIDRSNNGSLK